jgi:tetratricopeptide (TPR) repeat protein
MPKKSPPKISQSQALQPQSPKNAVDFSFLRNRLSLWTVMLLAFLLGANTLGFDYAVDDRFVIQENAYTQKGIKGIGKILTTDSFAGFYAYYNNPVDVLPGGRYRPLSLITYAIEHSLWGNSPSASHLINVLLYSLLCGFLLITLRQLLAKRPNGKAIALAAALLFTLHPTHTEAVANIKGRDEILSLLFLVASLYGLAQAEKRKEFSIKIARLWQWISCACFFLALLAKENGLTFLAIFPLTYYYFFEKNFKQSFKKSIPFGVIIIGYILIRAMVGLSFEESNSIMDNAYLWASMLERYATMTYMLLRYLVLTLFPYPLTWDYSYAAFPYITPGAWQFWAALLLHLGLLLYALLSLPRKTIAGFGLWFYLFSIFIVSGYLINIGGAMVADRFLFQPTLGACLAIGAGIVSVIQQLNFSTWLAKAALAVTLCSALLQGYYFYLRNKDWKDSDTLFRADGDKYPESARASEAAGQAWINYALSLKDSLEKKKYLQLAIPYLERAIKNHPQTVNGHLWLGRAYFIQNDLNTTEKYWKKAEAISPNEILVRQCMQLLSDTYKNQGLSALQKNELSQSLLLFEKALSLEPRNASVHFQLGILHGIRLKNLEKSIFHLQKAVDLEPQNPDYWYNLGGAFITANRKEEARLAWQKALSLNPNHAGARQGLAATAPIK